MSANENPISPVDPNNDIPISAVELSSQAPLGRNAKSEPAVNMETFSSSEESDSFDGGAEIESIYINNRGGEES